MLNIHDEQNVDAPVSPHQKKERQEISLERHSLASGPRWPPRLWDIVKGYPVPFMAVTLMLISLVFWLAGRGDIASWILLAVALLGGLPLLWETLKQ